MCLLASLKKSPLGCPLLKNGGSWSFDSGVPVLTVLRTAYDTNDVAVEVCDTVKVASAYLLEYEFPAR